MTGITILLVALVAVVAVGLFLKSRHGKVRVTTPAATGAADSRLELLRAAGVSSPHGGPVVLHFSADWCGPCAAVRRRSAERRVGKECVSKCQSWCSHVHYNT